MGQRGTTNCLLNFGDANECRAELLGTLHQGLPQMFQMMNGARIGVGYSSVMSGLAGYLYALEYAQERKQGRHIKSLSGDPVAIIEHVDVRRMLLAQKAFVEGGLALGLYCARLLDEQRTAASPELAAQRGRRLDLLTPIMKSWPSEYCLEANKLAIQVLGGYGYTRDFPVERFYRDNRLNHIHEGAWGIQALDLVGRKLRANGGEDLRDLLSEMKDTAREARVIGEIADEVLAIEGALDGLERALATTFACADIELSLANATPLLDGFGHVVIAWLWLLQAISALRRRESCGDSAFIRGKIAAFRYFCAYELPKVHATLVPVKSRVRVCLDMAPEEFAGA